MAEIPSNHPLREKGVHSNSHQRAGKVVSRDRAKDSTIPLVHLGLFDVTFTLEIVDWTLLILVDEPCTSAS